MITFLVAALVAVVVFIASWSMAWKAAHATVAHECRVLGKFYVGDEVFECRSITSISEQEHNQLEA